VKSSYFFFIALIFIFLISCHDKGTPQVQQENPVLEETDDASNQEIEPTNLEDRTSWQKPHLIISKLGNLQDKVVADIGAGTGYFSFQLMRKTNKVIAIEIDQNMIALMEAFAGTLNAEMRSKIEVRLGEPDDPKLKTNEADIALFVNVIPYLQDRVEYLSQLRSKLKTNGKVVIVDFKVRRLPIDAPPYNERVLPHIIEEELYAAGFSDITIDDSTLDFQYIIIAK